MLARHPARLIAPLALAGAAVAILIVVKHTPASHSTPTVSTPTTTAPVARAHHQTRHHFYTVKSGDTLSTISQKTGIAMKVIRELNPKLDPQALQPKQRIKLRP